MPSSTVETPDLELEFLRRGMVERAAQLERCGRCRRTPLIGERVYVYDRASLRCELCRSREREAPVASHVVRGPQFGVTMRLAEPSAA